MKYVSTRNKNVKVSGAEAIVQGISVDGGLFVPESFPVLSEEDIKSLCQMDYPERAAKIMSLYLDEFSYEELHDITKKAYSTFDGDPCPLVNIDENMNMLELWHGPTCAFKDMALTVLPYLLTQSKRKLGLKEKTLILVATSGDTGKAALEGFKDVEGVNVIVFYPAKGVSAMQKLQMQTQEGSNVSVAAIDGNFDDAQTAVKTVFVDASVKAELAEKGYALSSANSINWGRLLPQICYYVSAYCDLFSADRLKDGKFNVCVPTGNFGNILACYYAKLMGIPVDKIICASNDNKILTDFLNKGVYDTHREFYKTISPSMDILISSNLERLLFEIFDRDDEKICELMTALKTEGKYSVEKKVLRNKIPFFLAGYATQDETVDCIAAASDVYDYIMDPHTAVAYSVFVDYVTETGDSTPAVIVSTASPFKFPCVVSHAVNATNETDELKALKELSFWTGEEIPPQIKRLEQLPRRFTDVIDKNEVKKCVFAYLGDNNG